MLFLFSAVSIAALHSGSSLLYCLSASRSYVRVDDSRAVILASEFIFLPYYGVFGVSIVLHLVSEVVYKSR